MQDVHALRSDFLLGASASPVLFLGKCDFAAPLPCCIAIGAFDGVHEGHRMLIDRTVADARNRGLASVVVTFDPDPDMVVGSAPAPKLMCTDDRLGALSMSGADLVLVVPFSRELARMDHVAFFEQVLAPVLDIRSIHVGRDFRLGANGASTVGVIRSWGKPHSIDVFGHELVNSGGEAVSATRIRSSIRCGDMFAAAAMLGRTFMLRGSVQHGRGEGTDMGFPTANIDVGGLMCTPQEGVYAGFAKIGDRAYPAAINVGIPPTFADSISSAKMEANILGFSGDIYGCEIALTFAKQLRLPRTFDSLDALIATVKGNIQDVADMFGNEGRDLSL